MPALTRSDTWRDLQSHQQQLAGHSLRALFDADPKRFDRFSLRLNGLLLDYSKNLITEHTLVLLLKLAREADVAGWTARMFGGERVNNTENRAALHVALRSDGPVRSDGHDVMPEVHRVLEHMRRFSDAVRSGTLHGHTGRPFTDVVNIGIGGSDLGPAMITQALAPYGSPKLRVHFVSNVDPAHLSRTLAALDPETTLFVVASKTFTTEETLANARAAREWLLSSLRAGSAVARHFVAVSCNAEEVIHFGIAPNHLFEFWDWVGGRYSLWSAVGLSIALAVGMDNFMDLLAGARTMDRHFAEAPPEANMPLLLGLLAVWYNNFWGARACAVLPYDQNLARLPAYLQQLEMESLGKSVDRDGRPLECASGMVIWGEPGTNGQHAFFQLLHQGTQLIPADFLVAARSHYPLGDQHAMLLANCFAQGEALMRGKTEEEARAELTAQGLSGAALQALLPHRVFPGNRPSNTLVYPRLDPRTLGMLIALYEHKVFVQSVVWNVNAFDQWGVELGKQLAKHILPELAAPGSVDSHDASTNGLINYVKSGA